MPCAGGKLVWVFSLWLFAQARCEDVGVWLTDSSRRGAEEARLTGRRLEEDPDPDESPDIAETPDGEEGTPRAALASAAILVSSVIGMMTVFYLVKSKSPHVRKTTWQVLDSSVSIFCAVMWYQAHDQLLDDLNLEAGRILASVLHFAFWYHFTLLICHFTARISSEHKLVAVQAIGAHLCGFALKDVFVSVQETSPFRDTPGMAAVAVLLAVCFCALVASWGYCLAFKLRLLSPLLQEALVGIENDAFSLAVAFITTQCFRGVILGQPPDSEMGDDEHSPDHIAELLCSSLLFVFGICIVLVVSGRLSERLQEIGLTFNVMAIAWNSLYACSWAVCSMPWSREHKIFNRVFIAFILSAVCLAVLSILHALMAKFSGRLPGRMGPLFVRSIILGQGLSVAFSWEQAFDKSAEILTESLEEVSSAAAKYLVAVLLALFMLPGYANYIVPERVREVDGDRTEESKPEGSEPSPRSQAKAESDWRMDEVDGQVMDHEQDVQRAAI
eukprot:TRINITY_DN24633_c0_g1_i2.p1 TRINITY_DN24633_c0_g1~~TRINITY_DN24633_c0_g1_i2.p1  ORF type:complete len:502 (+),score=60.98 TRINITY_DN24633_c0_g1_i2:62-1567(+)